MRTALLPTSGAALLWTALLSMIAGPALAYYPPEKEVPQDTREFFVDEAKLPFDALPGLPSTRYWGIDEGAGYRIEVPDSWNGDLVVYTHGYRGNGPELTVDSPPLRQYYLALGYAWLASSYSKNYYDVRAGVESTNSLVRYFKHNIAEPNRTYITGFSMGGHVIGAAIEQFPNFACGHGRGGAICQRLVDLLGKLSGGVKYDGAAPHCGVMGDEALFDYFGDFSYGAETLAGAPSEFPPPPDYFDRIFLPTISALYVNPFDLLSGNGSTAVPNALGEKLRTYTVQISGGPRPLATTAFPYFQQLLFSFSGSDGTVDGIVSGNIYDNRKRAYQLDADPAVSAEEEAFNDAILRVRRDPGVNPRQLLHVERVPLITGRIDLPVLSDPHDGRSLRAVLHGADLRAGRGQAASLEEPGEPGDARHRPLRVLAGRADRDLRRSGLVGGGWRAARGRRHPRPGEPGRSALRLRVLARHDGEPPARALSVGRSRPLAGARGVRREGGSGGRPRKGRLAPQTPPSGSPVSRRVPAVRRPPGRPPRPRAARARPLRPPRPAPEPQPGAGTGRAPG